MCVCAKVAALTCYRFDLLHSTLYKKNRISHPKKPTWFSLYNVRKLPLYLTSEADSEILTNAR